MAAVAPKSASWQSKKHVTSMAGTNMNRGRILIAEDDDISRENLSELLCAYDVHSVGDGMQALKAFHEEKFDLIISDLRMPNMDGMHLLKHIREDDPRATVIMITGYGTVNTAVEAMKLGAFDYITKPLKDDLVKLTVERALSYVKLREENSSLKGHIKGRTESGKMIGYSDQMKKIFQTIEKVSSSDSTIIIYGESGTGKELVARSIHFNSDRRDQPLIPVNCGAIPEELLESELFGHEKGAFTGAIRSRMGRFELAQGGTIFLDEIGDMSPSLQVKVLRVIQEKQFERIGGIKTIQADVRIITATHQNLEQAVADRRFREDLYYRINVIPVRLPPLRERGMDIVILANHFLAHFNKLKKKQVRSITPAAMSLIRQYQWPGNVRELENLMEMLVVMKEDGEIDVDDLPEKISRNVNPVEPMGLPELTGEGLDFNRLVADFEKNLLLKALKMSGGVKNRAAKLLYLNRTTLVEKLKRLNLTEPFAG
jgi:DNA-binding NtrC family response regulator